MTMIDHLSLGVRDLARSRDFYDAILAPLGYCRGFDHDDAAGYGLSEKHPLGEQGLPFWIGSEAKGVALNGHVCFSAPDRAAVDAFHQAALAAGARDNGAPGLRPQYHASYYAAFVIDPNGHRLEAVCHQPEQSRELSR
ncbi:MAG TPA: VOC family protein [Stellaceae bacterium]|jgi:catechol 2,3-dioxygenase-like lactoylglutathione lyase family enzyme|nr:VOC family protein [Stellaceae bacterium]